MVDKLNTIKHKHALFFEDEKQYKEAEEKFIEAGKPKEAVLMYFLQLMGTGDWYLQAKDWTSAREVAEKYVPETLGDVLIGEAKLMFAQKNYSQGEALFLRAKMVNICIEMYQEAEMWEDALRLCKEYLPNKMTMLERKYEEYMASAGKQIGAEKIIKQARIYESSGQYTEAVSTFMKLTKEHTSDTNLLIKVWNRARELSLKFLGSSESTRISELVATKLIGIGKQLNVNLNITYTRGVNFSSFFGNFMATLKKMILEIFFAEKLASEVYLSLGLHKKAIFALVDGKHWERALKLAANIDLKLHELIETKFKKSLVNAGKVDQLVEVDPEAAVKVYASNGQWDKCFKLAERMVIFLKLSHQTLVTKKVSISNNYNCSDGKHMLGQYITICANSLIEKEDGIESLMVFCKYGIVTMTENIKLYKAIFANIIEKVELKNYGIWAALRTLFFKLYTSTDWSQESKEILSSSSITNINKIFEPYFLVSHYGAIRATCMDQAQGMKLAAKLSLACLRFCDIIPQDKAFYDAGSICKAAGVENVAFVLLNHFVDISEAIIEASNKNFLDISEFTSKTDFMCESKIPTKCYCSDTTVESIREWLLATSINTNIEQTLPVEANNKFESTLPQNSKFTDACIISGYPLEHSAIKFKNSSNMANKDDWNKYVMNAKVSKSDECQNVMTFIDKWNGPPTSPSSLTLI
ncbi:hypothetical protein A3Q56_00763 [Intoshia linei]|uniref:Uncharacterized protein n=1 Tax=Intoshia linei TaxID=1819745 RepID=A0A177BAW8_9BILA|nr:hypothetical protein A3Q56_00763 [Intoshia linei]